MSTGPRRIAGNRRPCLTPLLLNLLATAASAATHYVGPTGNDAFDGLSTTSAWATIQYAANHAAPGDTVEVLSGTYAGARIATSGASNAPIALRPAPGATVLLATPGPANKHNSILELESWDGDQVVRDWIVEGLSVSNSPKYGIDARSTQRLTLRGNTVVKSASTGIFTAFSYDALIEGNIATGNGEHGIYYNNSGDRFVIRGNSAFGNAHCGLHMNGDASIEAPPGSPWTADGLLSHGLVENNVIVANGPDGAAINMDGVTDTLVRNNIIALSSNNSGIALFGIDGAESSRNNMILNNTILTTSNGGWAINLSDPGCVSNTILNNIAYSDHPFRGSILIARADLPGFVCDHNVVTDRFSVDGGNSRLTLAAWRALGYDAHSLIASPPALFAAAPTNLQLRSTSPAMDAGTLNASAPADIAGKPRPLDGDGNGSPAADIGAYEFLLPTADSDRDGVRDGDEATAGTDPAMSRSFLAVRVDASTVTNGQAVVSWPSAAGRLYTLLTAGNTPSGFTTVVSNVVATPPMNTRTVALPPSGRAFFKLVIPAAP